MTRQNSQNNIKRVLNAKEAREYLGLPRYSFEKAVKEGSIEFKLIGTKKFFPVWCLEKWQNDITNHIDYIKEAKPTTLISHLYQRPEVGLSLESLLEQREKEKQLNIASKGYRNYKNRTVNKLAANCPA